MIEILKNTFITFIQWYKSQHPIVALLIFIDSIRTISWLFNNMIRLTKFLIELIVRHHNKIDAFLTNLGDLVSSLIYENHALINVRAFLYRTEKL